MKLNLKPKMRNKYKAVLKKIEREKWYLGVRGGDTPLVYSLRCVGEDKYIKKIFGKNYSQWRLLIPKEHGSIRAMGLTQAKKFHNLSKKTILKNPLLLKEKILEDEKLLKEAIIKSKQIKNRQEMMNVLILLQKHYFLFFLCFSYGMTLYKNKNKAKNKKRVYESLKIHDLWRNTVFKKEMEVLNNSDIFVRPFAKKNGLNINDVYYLELSEFIKALSREISENLKTKIEKRKKEFAYSFINGKSEILEEKEILEFLKDKFRENKNKHFLKGMVAYKNKGYFRGIVQILKEPKIKSKVKKNTILVVLQTDPKYLPIVKNFSAIITDEGGITCHAAIISREFKIPCIVGAKIATKILKNGDLVEMNLKTGEIKILN